MSVERIQSPLVLGVAKFTGTPQVDAIAEKTAATGVTIDGVLLKDAGITATGTAALSGAVTITGAATTTDGVTSGTARKIGGTASVAVAAGTSLTNSTSETVLASFSIPASTLKAGTVLRYRALARVTADAGATTLTARVRLGATTLIGTAIAALAATDTASGDHVWFEGVVVARAAPGAAAALVAFGQAGIGASGTPAGVLLALAPANYATNGALLLELTGQWSAADANAVQSEAMIVWVEG